VTLLLVSARLPVTVRRTADGFALSESVGGVATGLRSIHEARKARWIGWPGPTDQLVPSDLAEVERDLEGRRCVPVHLTRPSIRGFYLGYSNAVIWPLFHYLIQQTPLRKRYWQHYEEVNRLFAEVIAAHCGPDDEVWIHDYQLMRVPHHLRELVPEARIGFFLHIPFPSYEVYRTLPSRRLLLEGLLGADLVGFHTAAYGEHFTEAATRLLGVAGLEEGRIEYHGRAPQVGTFPMGIDAGPFRASIGGGPPVGKESTSPARSLLAIDRLDYTKGIPRRLLAFEQMLKRHHDLRERVSLLQVAVPSRTGVRAYQRFRRSVDEMVGRINGEYGTPGWTPVQYLYRGFSQAELIGLYRSADVMLVTPLRDGMNLVAKEFIASRVDGDGVLVLSEFAGAAAELAEAVQVNPFDIDDSAAAYYRALMMPPHERRARMRALQERVDANGVEHWAEAFVGALRGASAPAAPLVAVSDGEAVAATLDVLRRAPSLLLLLDYDGTLVPFAPSPELAEPDEDLMGLLAELAASPWIFAHLVSGRQRAVLDAWFGQLALGLHAEHGLWSRPPRGLAWQRGAGGEPVPYDEVLALLQRFTDVTPAARIERKSGGLAWHFRLSPPELATRHAGALVEEARRRFPPDRVDVLRGEKVVEFRPAGIHKGLIVARLLEDVAPGALVAAVGDDVTDEDMFVALPANGISIHVGPRASQARLRLHDSGACRAFLRGLLGSLVPGGR
jgi:trehalose 6-phosphate synthase/phosphatase